MLCARTAGTASSATVQAPATGEEPAKGVSRPLWEACWVSVGGTTIGVPVERPVLSFFYRSFLGFTAVQVSTFLVLVAWICMIRVRLQKGKVKDKYYHDHDTTFDYQRSFI